MADFKATYAVKVDWPNDGDGLFDGANDDISSYVKTISIDRGRDNELSACKVGACTVVLNNEDGRFSPDRSGSPMYGNMVPYRDVIV